MQPPKLMLNLMVQTGIVALLMAAILLGIGGAGWPQAWAWLVLFVASSAAFGLWLRRRDPGLLAARLAPPVQKGQPLWDRLFFLLIIPLWFGWLALMALDVRRWQASALPVWWNVLGALLVIGGFAGVCRVFAENSFAAPVVRVQDERRQRVIDTGPYARVRHPMYAAGILYMLGLPLLLGSRYGLFCLLLIALAVMLRAVFEERMLRRDLAGYGDYMRRVRWRLIPGIW